jgi:phytanoyl-CoA hydroxylase
MICDLANYIRDGFIVVENLLDAEEIASIKGEAASICRGERGQIDGLLLPKTGADADELMSRYLCIHFPHKISQVMLESMRHPRIVEVLTRIIGPNLKCMQSMLFIKNAGKPGQAWHQDENFIPTRDRSLTAAWIALDDATVHNGCLWALSGSHKGGILWPDQQHHDVRFDSVPEAYGFPWEREGGKCIEVRAGSVLFFNGYLLHRSLQNTAKNGFRRALVYHYMSAESLLPWDWAGRTPTTRDNRDIVLIAGQDPYAYKGLASITRPFLRTESGSLAAGGQT